MAQTRVVLRTPVKTTRVSAPKATVSKPEARSLKLEANSSSISAVFTTGGKQYRVKVGDLVKIEKLGDEYHEGDKITFDKVLMVEDDGAKVRIGSPFVQGASVSAILNKIARYKTIDVIKYKQKSRYFKKYGHRQPYFEVKIDSIK